MFITDDRINKMLCIQTVECLAVKRNEVLMRATAWMDLENIMQSGKGQA